jgi:PPOX class probable FMN-dependent enzyme
MPDDAKPAADATAITEEDALRAFVGAPNPLAAGKEKPALDAYTRRYIELCPFLVIASAGADGHLDVSPRGDPPGFVKVIDDTAIALPDRPGNKRVDTMSNLLANPQVSVIFFLPGYEETLRLRGRAALTRDPALLEAMAVDGKAPRLAIRIAIDTVFFHCAKALKRSRLWDPDARIGPGDYPRYAEIVRATRLPDRDADEIDAALQQNYRDELY